VLRSVTASLAARRLRAWRCGVALAVATGAAVSAAAGSEGLVAEFRADREGAGAAALALARSALDAWCLRHQRLQPPADLPPLLRKRSGVFVSAILGDAPRCCMGSLYPTRATLAEEIVAAAIAAAGMDLRFPPLRPEELGRLRVVVSVVNPPEPLPDASGLDPVRDGLAVRSATRWGVVLPGETPHRDLMLRWARIRAGAADDEPVEHFRLSAHRILEPVRSE
jgi:AMMECR1 domain-containing protein